MKPFMFRGIMVWVTTTGVILVALSIVFLAILELQIIDRAGAHNREVAFMLLSQSVSTMINQEGGIQDTRALEKMIHEIIEIRPGILRLSVYQILPQSSPLIVSTDPQLVPKVLDAQEQARVVAGDFFMQFDDAAGERALRMTAPIEINGKVVGALRGLFSMKEYDDLIKQETDLAKPIGIGVVVITSLTFWYLVRVKVHRPIQRLLHVIRGVEAEDLSGYALIQGPSEIREVAAQFNKMLDRVRESRAEKDCLLDKICRFNDTLQIRIAEVVEELQRANLELVDARLAAERNQRLAVLGEFSATVAHELGNPLNALSGHLQMLIGTTDCASRQRHLAVMRSEINRMVSIIKELLDQTRTQLRVDPVNINRTIQDLMALLSPGLPRQHVTLKTDLQDNLPPVASDARALHGVLLNLVTNAVQAMPLGGDLTIWTRVVFGERLPGMVIVGEGALIKDARVRLTIMDTGTGIPSEHLPRICEPFFTTRHSQGGTGLGLAICHRVVTDSGGRMAVRSQVGQGTEFTIDLPIWNTERNKRAINE